ncbi:transposase InsO family protein [Aeromonas salmonicida]|nr:transposase InsO family protein [Aeromonas salmonicida]
MINTPDSPIQKSDGCTHSGVVKIGRLKPRKPGHFCALINTRKLHYLLLGQDDVWLKVGRDRLFQILAEHRLLVPPMRAYHKTTHSFHRFYRHPNLLKAGPEQVTPVAPEQVWVADITYLPARSGPLYLSLVTDAYSRKIVGHHVHEGMLRIPAKLNSHSGQREHPDP